MLIFPDKFFAMPESRPPYKVKVNDYIFFIDEEEAEKADVITHPSGLNNYLQNGRSVNVQLVGEDETLMKNKAIINGNIYNVEIEDRLHQMLENMGLGAVTERVIKKLKAPMPGLVKSIDVKEGQKVKNGERLLILEAMKMENSIICHADAKVKKLMVAPGDAVEKGEVMIEFH